MLLKKRLSQNFNYNYYPQYKNVRRSHSKNKSIQKKKKIKHKVAILNKKFGENFTYITNSDTQLFSYTIIFCFGGM